MTKGVLSGRIFYRADLGILLFSIDMGQKRAGQPQIMVREMTKGVRV